MAGPTNISGSALWGEFIWAGSSRLGENMFKNPPPSPPSSPRQPANSPLPPRPPSRTHQKGAVFLSVPPCRSLRGGKGRSFYPEASVGVAAGEAPREMVATTMVDSRPDGAMEAANGCVGSGKRCCSLLCWFVCASFEEVEGRFVRFGPLCWGLHHCQERWFYVRCCGELVMGGWRGLVDLFLFLFFD